MPGLVYLDDFSDYLRSTLASSTTTVNILFGMKWMQVSVSFSWIRKGRVKFKAEPFLLSTAHYPSYGK